MRILAMETAFDPSGFALADERGIVASMTFRHERDLSRWWAPRLRWTMDQIGWKPADLDGFAVCSGPGSFTGLRIGVSAVKTMAQAIDRPIVGLTSLELIALPYRSAWPATIVSVLYCRRGEVYRSAYAEGGAVLREPAVMSVDEFSHELRDLPVPILLCGHEGAANALELPPGTRRSDPWLSLPHVDRLALEGHRRLMAGEGSPADDLAVVYLKRSQAEELAARRHVESSAGPVPGGGGDAPIGGAAAAPIDGAARGTAGAEPA